MITYSAAVSACEMGNRPDKDTELPGSCCKRRGIHVIDHNGAISACMKRQPDKVWEL